MAFELIKIDTKVNITNEVMDCMGLPYAHPLRAFVEQVMEAHSDILRELHGA